jgi:uncharacterized protein YkwD
MFLFKAATVAMVVMLLADGSAPTKKPQAEATTKNKVAPKVQPTAFRLHPVEAKVVEQTNAARARHGLPPLVVDQHLVQSARAHTAWMTRARRLRHTSRPVAENIAMGQSTAREAVRSWMSSSGHRANILNRGYRRIGVSAYTAPDGTVYWTQQFEP